MVAVRSIDHAIQFVTSKPHPLALYIFSSSTVRCAVYVAPAPALARVSSRVAARQAVKDDIMSRTTSGGVCVNETVMHFSNPHLPFGGTVLHGWCAYTASP